MSVKPTISISLTELSDGNALVQAKMVLAAMITNPHFPTPDVSFILVQEAIEEMDLNLSISKKGTPVETAAKNKSRYKLNDVYSNLGHYVIRIAKGDLEILRSSKFNMVQDKVYKEIPVFAVKNGLNPGDVEFTSNVDENANAYEVHFRIVSGTSPTEWAHCKTFGGHKGFKSGFISLELYEFKMKVIYSQSEGAFCDAISLRVM